MKALCDREELLTAFSMVSGVAPARSPKPILQNLKLIVDRDEGSTLLATDMEVGIRYRVLGVKVDQSGAVILPSQKMMQILRTNTDKEIALDLNNDQLWVRTLGSKINLLSEDPSLFPEFPDFTATSHHVVGAADLRKMIRRTIFATEPESTRFALGGVLFELSDNEIVLVGTDGRRLAHAVAHAEAENGAQPPQGQPVVPVKALKLIERNLDDDDPPVHLAFPTPNSILVRTDRAVIYSRLVEGRFPRYRDVFPPPPEEKIPVEVGVFRNRIELAAIATSDESRGVDFKFVEGNLILCGHAADVGASEVSMPIPYQGKTIEITFDPHYLLDALKTLPEDSTLSVELIDDHSPVVFRSADRYSYVVMPLTRGG